MDLKTYLDEQGIAYTDTGSGLYVYDDLDLLGTSITALPAGLQVDGDLDLEATPITELPEGLEVGGALDLTHTPITKLPAGLKVHGDLDLSYSAITELPADLKVGGGMYLNSTPITALPSGLKVGRTLDLSGTGITDLPACLDVGGSLYMSDTPITALPVGLQVGGALYLSFTKIAELPAGLQVGGDLDLDATPITELPADLKVGGSLCLRHTPITDLPEGLKVGRNLNLSHTAVTELPADLQVGGDLDLENTPIRELRANLKVGGNLNLTGTGITELPKGLEVGGYFIGLMSGPTLELAYLNEVESLAKQSIANPDRWSPDDVMNTAESIDIRSTLELGGQNPKVRAMITLGCEFSFESENWTQGVVQIDVPSIEGPDDAERLLTSDARKAIRHQVCEALRFYMDMILACEAKGLPVPFNPEIRVHFCQDAVCQVFQTDKAYPTLPEVKNIYKWDPVSELRTRLGRITTSNEAAVALDDFLKTSGLHDGLARSMTVDEIMYDLKLAGRSHEAELMQAAHDRIQMAETTADNSASLDAAKAAALRFRDRTGVDIAVRHDGADIVGEIELPSTLIPNGIMFEGSVLVRFERVPKVEMLIEPEVFDAATSHLPSLRAIQSAIEHLLSYAADSTHDPAQIEQMWVKGIPDHHETDGRSIKEQIDALVDSASSGEVRLSRPDEGQDPLAPGDKLSAFEMGRSH